MRTKLLFTFLLVTLLSNAQTYSVQTSFEPYLPLSSANSINIIPVDTTFYTINGVVYNVPYYSKIPIGFDYTFESEMFDSLRLAQDGFVQFQENDTSKYWISMFDCDMSDTTSGFNSELHYITEGTVGNRILKVQYSNFGLADDLELDDTVNFQLWLYEDCGNFEVRIGPGYINSNVWWFNVTSPLIGIGNYIANTRTFLSGDPAAPDFINSQPSGSMSGTPPEGAVYRFSNCSAGIDESEIIEAAIYPNPATDFVRFELNGKPIDEVHLIKTDGRIMNTLNGDSHDYLDVNLKDLTPGVYFLSTKYKGRLITQRVIKY